MKIIGVLLIAIGLVGLIYGGVSWVQRDKVVDLGPIQVTQEHHKSVPLPPIVGGVCLVAGVFLLMRGGVRAAA
jgi:uncharacterized membrane protein YidH (DUF202 family)